MASDPPAYKLSLEESMRFFSEHADTGHLLAGHNIHLPDSFNAKASGEDSLFARTLPHPLRISHCLALLPKTAKPTSGTILIALGTDLAGHPNILHGGITAVILDEAAGIVLTADCNSRGEPLGLFTTRLETIYRAPIMLPGVVAIEMAIVERGDRAVKLRGVIKQQGRECAIGELTFKRPRTKI